MARVPQQWAPLIYGVIQAAITTKRIFLTAIVAVGIGVAGASLASAQSYPDRLIKIVVPYPHGGPADVAARLVTQPLSTRLGQSVIVENQPGGGGRTGAKFVAHASADGYTLLLGGTNPNAIASLYRTLDFEPIKDFAAVGLIAFDSNALVVNPAVPAKTLQELVQYVKPIRASSRPAPRWASVRMSASSSSGSEPPATSFSFLTKALRPRLRICWVARFRSA